MASGSRTPRPLRRRDLTRNALVAATRVAADPGGRLAAISTFRGGAAQRDAAFRLRPRPE